MARFLRTVAFVTSVIVTSSIALGQNFERYQPKLPPRSADIPKVPMENPDAATGSDQILVERLDCILILDRETKLNPTDPHTDLEGIRFNVDNPKSILKTARGQQLLQKYLGQPITLRRLSELSREIVLLYRNCDQPVVDVQLLEQNITAGTVQLVVVESRVGQVQLRGFCQSDPEWLRQQISCTRPGSSIRNSWLSEDLYQLNQSPFRRVELDMQPGQMDGTTDVFFDVHEVTPFRAYVGYEDTGVRVLALERLIAGFQIGNIFGRDGTIGYQYTADPSFELLEAHATSFAYDWDNNWGMMSYGSWSGVNPDLVAPFNQGGESWQTGLFINRYLVNSSQQSQTLSAGIDYKSTNNNLEFNGVNVQSSQADLFQLNMGYDTLHRHANGRDYWRHSSDLFVGPGDGLTSHNTSQAFQTIRANTDPTYWYYRGVAERQWTMPYCTELMARGTGQVSNERLLFSETLGFGGFDTIRGYDQRVVNGDAGWILNLEYGPRGTRSTLGSNPTYRKFFCFGDMGQSFIHDAVAGEDSSQLISGVGVGMRYTIANRLTWRLDYGHSLNDIPGASTNDRIHIGLVSFFGPVP